MEFKMNRLMYSSFMFSYVGCLVLYDGLFGFGRSYGHISEVLFYNRASEHVG
jgi:hypothetical protein